jgi:hypothetical protein
MLRLREHVVSATIGATLCVVLAATVLARDGLTAVVGVASPYDLAADWSDAANPNGVWSYRSGSTVLPGVADWTLLTEPTVQPAWAPGQTIPAWFKSVADNPEGMDFLAGDVVVHSAGVAENSANVQ